MCACSSHVLHQESIRQHINYQEFMRNFNQQGCSADQQHVQQEQEGRPSCRPMELGRKLVDCTQSRQSQPPWLELPFDTSAMRDTTSDALIAFDQPPLKSGSGTRIRNPANHCCHSSLQNFSFRIKFAQPFMCQLGKLCYILCSIPIDLAATCTCYGSDDRCSTDLQSCAPLHPQR